MPCATVHLLTAGRTLDRWRERPARAPFDVANPALIQDYLSGTMAPDMGFVPGIDRLTSELVHYVRTGDLVRTLLLRAGSPGEVAFSWGWAIHHLTDVIIHPMVGRSVGEILYGDRDRRVNASEDEEVHVSVEVGLDILVQRADASIPPPAPEQELQAGQLEFLKVALEETYGIPWDMGRLAGDYRLASRQIRAWPKLIRRLGTAWRIGAEPAGKNGPFGSGAPATLRAASALAPSGSALRGFLRPRTPPTWLPQQVWRTAEEFPDRFQEIVDSWGALVENRNLETGQLEPEATDHPGTGRVRARWRRLLGTEKGG